MSDVRRYIEKRKARKTAGLTQEEVARRLNTTKSAISRLENHADEVRLSTLKRYAEAVGADLRIKLAAQLRMRRFEDSTMPKI